MREVRAACALVAERARSVRIADDALPGYAASLPLAEPRVGAPVLGPSEGDRERLCAYWLTLDAINFGSGWFPTLRKREGRSGYRTIEHGLRSREAAHGPWRAEQLERIDARSLAGVLDQDLHHPLLRLFALSLRDLGRHIRVEYGGSFTAVAQAAGGSAVKLARTLGGWRCFEDVSRYGELTVPFLKRAQIAAADLDRAGAARFGDLPELTAFADNLVPHVLRLDGVLSFAPELVARIEAGTLIEHGSLEEIEIRACTVQAVELIVRARGDTSAAEIDQVLWSRGAGARYKAVPRHRSRCTAY